jgi:membrane protein DedA with SNARE-associated domain
VTNSGLVHTLSTLGYVAVGLFILIESLGVPFPGESILITASVLAGTTHQLNIAGVIIAAVIGAVVGDNIGFTIGWFGGYPLLRRFGRYIRLDEPKLKVGRYLFLKQGGKVVFFGRFVAILRTYAAFLAGTNRMHWAHFVVANASGGVCWAVFWGVAAYLLGNEIDRVGRPLQIGFIAAGVLAAVIGVLFVRTHAKRLEATAERALPGPLEGFSQ